MKNIWNDNRNGHGYQVFVPEMSSSPEFLEFADTNSIIRKTMLNGDCLVSGPVGAGKSSLMREIAEVVLAEDRADAVLVLSAHKNGGCQEGAINALAVTDVFVEKFGKDGLIIVDNADYYGYSGRRSKRSYSRALAHIPVARYFTDLLSETDRPLIIGAAHTEQWRRKKWGYVDRECDEVTPAAQTFLDSFHSRYVFNGRLSEDVASRMLGASFDKDTAVELQSLLVSCGALYHHIVRRITPSTIQESGGIIRNLQAISEQRQKLS